MNNKNSCVVCGISWSRSTPVRMMNESTGLVCFDHMTKESQAMVMATLESNKDYSSILESDSAKWKKVNGQHSSYWD